MTTVPPVDGDKAWDHPTAQRGLTNHLAPFHRLVERRTITLTRAALWARQRDVTDFISIDSELTRR